jgi:hypothetical protein
LLKCRHELNQLCVVRVSKARMRKRVEEMDKNTYNVLVRDSHRDMYERLCQYIIIMN